MPVTEMRRIGFYTLPKVHPTHLKANKAVAALVSRLAEVEILAETISNDYGEDLLLQTHHDNWADSFSIRVQVKHADLKRNRKGELSYSFETEHLWRWANHSDPVLVFIFDKSSSDFFMISPKEHFSIWDLANTAKKNLTIKFSDKNRANVMSLKDMIWRERIRYFSKMIADLESRHFYNVTPKKSDFLETATVVSNLIKSIGILEDDCFSAGFRTSVTNASNNFAKKEDHRELGLRGAFMLSVLGELDKITKSGMPLNVLEHCTEVSGHYFRCFHNADWRKLSAKFDEAWYPFGIRKLSKSALKK